VNERNDPRLRLGTTLIAFCILLQLLALVTAMVVQSYRDGSESTFETPPGMPTLPQHIRQ
jgi:hypothetical protein